MHNLVSANVLGDTAGFATRNIRLANSIQQGCFSMVNVPQDGNNWWAHHKIFGVFIHNQATPKWQLTKLFNSFFFLFKLRLKTQFCGNHSSSIKVNLLIDARHNTVGHQNLNNLHSAGIQHSGQRAHGHTIRELNNFLFFAHVYLRFLQTIQG